MVSTYKIGVVQTSFENGNVPKNLKHMRWWAEESKRLHPDLRLLVFPELSSTGYYLSSQLISLSERKDGPIFQYMSQTAKDFDLYICYGYPEKGEQGKLYNSVMLVSPEGKEVANYRKIHITSMETGIFYPGDDFISEQTELGRIGLMICWDLAFPETARILAAQGSDLILSPSAWEHPYQTPYQRFAMARAIDNSVYLATSNHIGQSDDLKFFGLSTVYCPDGTVMNQVDEGKEGLAVVEIDMQKREELKQSFYTMLSERRTDLY